MKLTHMLMALAAAAVLAGAGCEGITDTLVVRTTAKGGVVHSLFFSATRRGTMLAKVYGDPFGGGERAVIDASLRGLADGVSNRVVRFVDDAGAVEQPQNLLIVVFGARPTVSGAELCSGVVPESRPSEVKGTLTVRAVFCSSGESLSDVEGVGRNLSGPEDPKFRQMMHDVANQLLVAVPGDEGCNSSASGNCL